MKPLSTPTERRLLRRLQWRLALGFAAAFLVFDMIVVSLTYVVLDYHFYTEARSAITATWHQESTVQQHHDPDEHPGVRNPIPGHIPHLPSSDDYPRVVSWRFGTQDQFLSGFPGVYGLPVGVNAILPDRKLLSKARHTHQPTFAVIEYQQYRVLVGSRSFWKGSRFLGSEQSIYSMGRLESLMTGLVSVDLEISAVMVALIIVLAFWLSGRSLDPIRAALRRQRDFIQDVSHELRTPLTIVKSTLELAMTEENRTDVDQAIQSTLQEVDYVTRLMSDLATLARIDSGATLIEPELFDLFHMTDEVVAGLTPLAEERGIRLSASQQGSDGEVLGDPVHVRQLLLILLDNALKYNHANGWAHIEVGVSADTVTVAVANSGPGIPFEDLPHVFNRLYRSRATNRSAPGSGLGLAIADWIVRSHRGTIHVSSDPGQGTTFEVKWPRRWESA